MKRDCGPCELHIPPTFARALAPDAECVSSVADCAGPRQASRERSFGETPNTVVQLAGPVRDSGALRTTVARQAAHERNPGEFPNAT
eukprot:9315621-Alexandrium_andersonii.AAC.1